MNQVYHISKAGSDNNDGSIEKPFLTIQRAANVAAGNDKVIVHEGIYREWVKPQYGGIHDGCRVIYEAAEGEKVIIKGSEIIKNWKCVDGSVWKAVIPNTLFGTYNPYQMVLAGDWLVDPRDYNVHLGEVYLNGKSFYEAAALEEVYVPKKRYVSTQETWCGREERILEPEQTLYQWYSEVTNTETIIYANFQGANPNKELVEINVREACFGPDKIGVNYITVRGFEMAQAATQWAPPTAVQVGLIGPNWSKGWVIENNIIHDSKCSGISLGKEITTGNNDHSKFGRKPGYQYQMEAVFLARGIGWSKERIGSHVIRSNVIYNCGQTGIVGHLGCVFSEIYENEIYNIAVKHEYWGHEIAGIKLHAAIDVLIHDNYIHNCSLGLWLDWQAQNTRISRNIFDQNNRDFMIEVTHGPYLVDNNIFTSPFSLVNAAQGGAYVHNLIAGFMQHYPVLNRSTPYHFAHSTEVLGTTLVYGGDDRWYQNLFIGGEEENQLYGTADYNGAPISLNEYISLEQSLGNGDVEQYEQIKQPAYINGNAYLAGAKHFDREDIYYSSENKGDNVEETYPNMALVQEGAEVFLKIMLSKEILSLPTKIITTDDLGMPRIVEAQFENPDGTKIVLNQDLNGVVRSAMPKVGPMETLQAGENKIKVWTRRLI